MVYKNNKWMLYNLIFDNFEVIIVLYCIVFVIDGIGN